MPSCHPAPDFSTHTIAIDRSQSGITVSDTFSASDRQAKVVTNPDGSVDLHIFVDRMSVEVFTADDTISDANQIFPTGYPDGLAAFAENGVATLDATVHQLAGIWTVKGEQSLTPTGISVDATSVVANPGATSDVRVWVTPGYTDQGWTVSSSDPGVAWVVRADTGLSIVASRPGTTTITIASAADPSITKTITVTVHANEFKTNVDGLTPTAGTWHIDGRAYHVDGTGLIAYQLTDQDKADARAYEKGYVGLGVWDTAMTRRTPSRSPLLLRHPGSATITIMGGTGAGTVAGGVATIPVVVCGIAGMVQQLAPRWSSSCSHQHGFQSVWGSYRLWIGCLTYCRQVRGDARRR
ncbi:MAG: GH32 C-terminal domain-containing protein [Olsenella profusa]